MARFDRLNIVAVALVLVVFAFATSTSHPLLPDPKLTPGATDPAVTQATIRQTICQPNYTSSVRDVTEATKREVRSRYNLPASELSRVEVDHYISLEVGGSSEVSNLWPQYYEPKPGAREKDVVETWLHRQICSGKLTLKEAQDEIRLWPQVYKKLEAAKR